VPLSCPATGLSPGTPPSPRLKPTIGGLPRECPGTPIEVNGQRERVRRGGAGRRAASSQRRVRQQDACRVFPATRMFDPRSFFPWDCRSPVSHPTCDVPFPPRRTDEYWKGMIDPRPLRSGWDPETSRERVGDWGGPETVWALLWVAERRATRPRRVGV
jgi:hypothetical protein